MELLVLPFYYVLQYVPHLLFERICKTKSVVASPANDISLPVVPRGLGLHIWAAPVDAMKSYFLGLYVTSYAFTLSIFTTKAAILAFYWRIFHSDLRIRWPLIILFSFLSVWTVILVCESQNHDLFWFIHDRSDRLTTLTDFGQHTSVPANQRILDQI